MNRDTNEEMQELRINLYTSRGDTSRWVDAEINEQGDLVIEGYDLGKDVKEFWGDSDYEFWVHVAAKDKDRVLLALLRKLYEGHFSALDEFRTYMESCGIPCQFSSWV